MSTPDIRGINGISNKTALTKVSMRLFGIPYQMPSTVDPRDISINQAVGKNFLEKFLLEAPILTVIPGDPLFLPESGKNEKNGSAIALLEAAGEGKFGSGFELSKKSDNVRLYDFQKSYREYMRYVNLLCRVGAAYLDLDAQLTVDGKSVAAESFDWKTYKWLSGTGSNAQNFVRWLGASFNKAIKVKDSSGSDNDGYRFSDVLTDYDYIQFYIDPDGTSGDDMGNASSESMMKGLFDGVSGKTKELAWMLRNSDFAGNMANFAAESTDQLTSALTEALSGSDGAMSSVMSALSRVINLSSNVIMGENVIIPNIYSSSSYNKSGFTATIHLKAPYGSVLSYYMDVFVPLMHLVALTIPRQSSPNTYSSPFLCKSFIEGSWTCNLGIVSGLSISKSNESRSINGLPSEVDVTIQFEDLYATLSMNSTSEPNAFARNSSLVEYLATNCGVSLTKPNAEKKASALINTTIKTFTDAPSNIAGGISSAIYENTIGKLRNLLYI